MGKIKVFVTETERDLINLLYRNLPDNFTIIRINGGKVGRFYHSYRVRVGQNFHTSGLPDLIVMCPDSTVRFIEVKTRNTKISDSQKVLLSEMEAAGLKVRVLKGGSAIAKYCQNLKNKFKNEKEDKKMAKLRKGGKSGNGSYGDMDRLIEELPDNLWLSWECTVVKEELGEDLKYTKAGKEYKKLTVNLTIQANGRLYDINIVEWDFNVITDQFEDEDEALDTENWVGLKFCIYADRSTKYPRIKYLPPKPKFVGLEDVAEEHLKQDTEPKGDPAQTAKYYRQKILANVAEWPKDLPDIEPTAAMASAKLDRLGRLYKKYFDDNIIEF